MDRANFPEELTSVPLAGSRVKLLRVTQFATELSAEANDYKGASPISAEFVGGQLQVSWTSITLKPAAILGDALHNLRAALDLAACELVRTHTGSDDAVHFPFAKDAASLDAAIRSRRLHQAGEGVVALISSYAPYVGGSVYLSGLHQLDIQDKHRGILLAGSRMTITGVAVYAIDGSIKPEVQADLSNFEYIFADTSAAFAGRPVLDVLDSMTKVVTEIVDALEGFLPS